MIRMFFAKKMLQRHNFAATQIQKHWRGKSGRMDIFWENLEASEGESEGLSEGGLKTCVKE